MAVESVKKKDFNVLGWLPSPSSATGNEVVMIGAHYDHLGHGESGGLAVKGEEGVGRRGTRQPAPRREMVP